MTRYVAVWDGRWMRSSVCPVPVVRAALRPYAAVRSEGSARSSPAR